MKTNFLITMMFLIGLWSCNSDQVLFSNEIELQGMATEVNLEAAGLKSGEVGVLNECAAAHIPLLHKGKTVGEMQVMHHNNNLIVLFQGDADHDLTLVQLWVGTDAEQIPLNEIGKPAPGKFPFNDAGFNNFTFLIPQEQIAPGYQLSEGNPLMLAAHVETTNKQSGTKESAWSEGTPISPDGVASYSEYTPCDPTSVGGGCFPFTAFCGLLMDNEFYFDVAQDVQQHIVIKTGKNTWEDIGAVNFDSGNIYFDFNQDWYFTDLLEPQLIVTGYKKLGSKGKIVYSGVPLRPQPPIYYYYGPLGEYNYYTIEIKVQYCY